MALFGSIGIKYKSILVRIIKNNNKDKSLQCKKSIEPNVKIKLNLCNFDFKINNIYLMHIFL